MAKNKLYFIEILRAFSMLSVVFLHSAATALRTGIGSLSWQAVNLITSLLTISVPVFFMISGCLLLSSDKTKDFDYTYKVRLPKLLIPLLAWSVVSLIKDFLINSPSPENLLLLFQKILLIPKGSVAIHFWFMYTLIPLYLISPFLKYLIDALPEKAFNILLIIWLSTLTVFTVRGLLPDSIAQYLNISFLNSINFLGGYLGYFLFGYFLFIKKINISDKLLIVTSFVFVALIAIATYLKSAAMETYVEQFKSYVSLYVIILSSAVFVLTKKMPENIKFGKSLSFISSLSFGIYLMHNVVISVLNSKGFLGTDILTVLTRFAITILLCIIALIFVTSIKPICYLFTGISYKSACESCNLFFLLKSLKKNVN